MHDATSPAGFLHLIIPWPQYSKNKNQCVDSPDIVSISCLCHTENYGCGSMPYELYLLRLVLLRKNIIYPSNCMLCVFEHGEKLHYYRI